MASRSRKTILSNPLDDIKPQSILKNTPPKDASSEAIAKPPKKVAVKKSITKSTKIDLNVSEKNLNVHDPLKKTGKKTDKKNIKTYADANNSSANEESNFDKLAEIVLLDSANHQDKSTKKSAQSTNNFSDAKHNQTRAENVFDAELSQDPPLVLTRVRITSDRETRAMSIVKTWSQWSVAAGIVPVPLVDIALVSGIQIKMIYDLCQVYNVPFEKKSALAVVSGLIGGSLSAGVARVAGEMALKTIPYVEQVLQPTLAFATTYSMGYVFVKHFENAGTLLNFDGSKMNMYFQEQFEKSKKLFPKKQTANA